MSFLPEGYEGVPSNSAYMKFEDGKNTIRILSSAVVGFEYWNIQNKPIRSKVPWTVLPDDCKLNDKGKKSMNHFWAFMVWNYEQKKVMLLQVTQKTVQEAIELLVSNPKWGDPKGYDIIITKTKAGDKISYQTQADPHSPVSAEIAKAYMEISVNLEALFTGDDPFGSTPRSSATPAAVVEQQARTITGDESKPAPDFLQ